MNKEGFNMRKYLEYRKIMEMKGGGSAAVAGYKTDGIYAV